MNNERCASYMGGGLSYKKKQYVVEQPVAFHLQLLKEKLKQKKSSPQIPHTSSPPLSLDKSLNHNPHLCHKESHQEQQSLQENVH